MAPNDPNEPLPTTPVSPAQPSQALSRDGEEDYREYLRRQGDGRARLGDLMEKFNRRKG